MTSSTASATSGRIQADGGGFGGVSFYLSHRKSYGYATPSLDEAKAAFRAEYQTWKNGST
jgi:hypothetical protein